MSTAPLHENTAINVTFQSSKCILTKICTTFILTYLSVCLNEYKHHNQEQTQNCCFKHNKFYFTEQSMAKIANSEEETSDHTLLKTFFSVEQQITK